MTTIVLLLIPVALAVAAPTTWLVRAVSRRLAAFDSAGVPGQVKAPRRVPNTGGIGIVAGFVIPIAVGLVILWSGLVEWPSASGGGTIARAADAVRPHVPGLRHQTPLALTMLGGVLLLHVLGLIDDRRPLGPFLKLAVMALPAVAVAVGSDTRLFTFLDAPAAGPWLSIALTVVWILVVTNALNFMDNMDGLSAGVGAIAAACLLAVALLGGQWFVAGCLALLIGALLGFLLFNRPPATIFMGDGGSLVLGFLLAFLSVRITYTSPDAVGDTPPGANGVGMFATLTPLIVLAVPLYDFVSVCVLRLRQGKSPFVGDMQHLSHRIAARGLSRPLAVATICGFSAAIGLGAVFLRSMTEPHAILVGLQTVLLLIVLAALEFGGNSGNDGRAR